MTTTLIKQALSEIEPQAPNGALVSVRALRRYVGNPPDFDASILVLADQGVLALHHVDHPSDVGPSLDGLVCDRRPGSRPDWSDYVLGVAIRS